MIDFTNETNIKGLVLVDFFATWCGPCKMLSPVLEDIKEEYKDSLKVIKVDIDKEEDLTREFSIRSVPTLLLIKDGKVVSSKIGFQPKQALTSWIESYK